MQQNGAGYSDDKCSYTLNTIDVHCCVYPINTMVATRFPVIGRGTGMGIGCKDDAGFTISATHEHGIGGKMEEKYVVRRLMPIECERLQGFPDGWTDIPYKGNEHAPDTPRYKAIGNSMAVPVMRWIGKRIDECERGWLNADS